MGLQPLGLARRVQAGAALTPITLADWILNWNAGNDTGLSSRSIVCVMTGTPAKLLLASWGIHAPSDPSDVGRCVRLLNLAETHGAHWRARMGEMASAGKEWAALAPRWADIEVAYHEDVVAQDAWSKAMAGIPKPKWPKTGPKKGERVVHPKWVDMPPARSYHLIKVLTGWRDPYADKDVPWPREPSPVGAP